MTERFHSLTVVLDKNYREDDAQAIINAILMIKSVIKVEGNVDDPGQFVAEARVRRELADKLWAVLYPKN